MSHPPQLARWLPILVTIATLFGGAIYKFSAVETTVENLTDRVDALDSTVQLLNGNQIDVKTALGGIDEKLDDILDAE